VVMERGFVKVSPMMETSVKGLYAIGDMAGNQLLAHKAMAEGVVAAEAIAGRSPRPSTTETFPRVLLPASGSLHRIDRGKGPREGREVLVGAFPSPPTARPWRSGRRRASQGGR
jgi:dihydrolipoamide dehydrogenase